MLFVASWFECWNIIIFCKLLNLTHQIPNGYNFCITRYVFFMYMYICSLFICQYFRMRFSFSFISHNQIRRYFLRHSYSDYVMALNLLGIGHARKMSLVRRLAASLFVVSGCRTLSHIPSSRKASRATCLDFLLSLFPVSEAFTVFTVVCRTLRAFQWSPCTASTSTLRNPGSVQVPVIARGKEGWEVWRFL